MQPLIGFSGGVLASRRAAVQPLALLPGDLSESKILVVGLGDRLLVLNLPLEGLEEKLLRLLLPAVVTRLREPKGGADAWRGLAWAVSSPVDELSANICANSL